MEGILRNVSDSGALLLVDTATRLPMDLDVSTNGSPTRRAHIVWRGDGVVGIAFAESTSAEPIVPSARATTVVSLAEVREARRVSSDEDRLAARLAAVLRRSERSRPNQG